MKYVAYYRVSTRSQGDSGLGLSAQRAYIEHFISKSDIVTDFTEVATAKLMDCKSRPKLCEALQLCKDEGYSLVVAKIDRLSRTTEHALEIYSQLDGKLVSCDIPNLDKFTLTIFMAIADRERELISIRTKQALAEKKRDGYKLGKPENFTNKGRLKGSAANQLRAKQKKSNKQAAELCQLYRANSLTYQQIADKLNSQGYTSSKGKEFKPTTVMRLLKRKAS